MRDQTLLYWGMVVTIFLLFAALLTARQLFEMYLQERQKRDEEQAHGEDTHAGQSQR